MLFEQPFIRRHRAWARAHLAANLDLNANRNTPGTDHKITGTTGTTAGTSGQSDTSGSGGLHPSCRVFTHQSTVSFCASVYVCVSIVLSVSTMLLLISWILTNQTHNLST